MVEEGGREAVPKVRSSPTLWCWTASQSSDWDEHWCCGRFSIRRSDILRCPSGSGVRCSRKSELRQGPEQDMLVLRTRLVHLMSTQLFATPPCPPFRATAPCAPICTKVVHWRYATFRETMPGLLWRASGPDRHRPGRRIRARTGRRWDDPLQKACGSGVPWQQEALDKAARSNKEEEFLCRALCQRLCQRPPPGRFMVEATPD